MSGLQDDISAIKKTIKQDVTLKNVASKDNFSPDRDQLLENEKLQTENEGLREEVRQLKDQAATQNIGDYQNLNDIKTLFESKLQQLQAENEEKEKFFFELRHRESVRQHEIELKNELIHKLQRQIHSITRPNDKLNLLSDLNDLQHNSSHGNLQNNS